MMHYAINYDNGYIVGVVAGVSAENSNCNEAEYRAVREMLLHPPAAPEGYYPRLREDRQWELCPLPEISVDASESDYITALSELGVAL